MVLALSALTGRSHPRTSTCGCGRAYNCIINVEKDCEISTQLRIDAPACRTLNIPSPARLYLENHLRTSLECLPLQSTTLFHYPTPSRYPALDLEFTSLPLPFAHSHAFLLYKPDTGILTLRSSMPTNMRSAKLYGNQASLGPRCSSAPRFSRQAEALESPTRNVSTA